MVEAWGMASDFIPKVDRIIWSCVSKRPGSVGPHSPPRYGASFRNSKEISNVATPNPFASDSFA